MDDKVLRLRPKLLALAGLNAPQSAKSFRIMMQFSHQARSPDLMLRLTPFVLRRSKELFAFSLLASVAGWRLITAQLFAKS
jgi:hypothetical protein